MPYTIGEISERTGLTISQIRYYDKEGLIPGIARNDAGIRQFTDGDVQWIGVVTCLKNSGVPLRRIRQFVEWAQQGDSTIDKRLNFMREQREYLEDQIELLGEYMRIVDGKIKYYEIAAEAGTVAVHDKPIEPQASPQKNKDGSKKVSW